MSGRRKMTDEERIAAITEYLDGKGSYHSIANKHGIDYSYFRKLVNRAKAEGIESIKVKPPKKYTAETKLVAVQEYLAVAYSRIIQKSASEDTLINDLLTLFDIFCGII